MSVREEKPEKLKSSRLNELIFWSRLTAAPLPAKLDKLVWQKDLVKRIIASWQVKEKVGFLPFLQHFFAAEHICILGRF